MRWLEHFIDWTLKFYWMSCICLTLFLVSPNPYGTSVSSLCWWDSGIKEWMQQGFPPDYDDGRLHFQVEESGWGDQHLTSLALEEFVLWKKIASISALPWHSIVTRSSADYITSQILISSPLHEGKENSLCSYGLGLTEDRKDKNVKQDLVQLKAYAQKARPWHSASITLELCPANTSMSLSPSSGIIVAARGISHHTTPHSFSKDMLELSQPLPHLNSYLSHQSRLGTLAQINIQLS